MSIETALQSLRDDPALMRNVTAWQQAPARPARTTSLPADLDARLAAALRSRGIDALYSHQAAAWQAAQAGQNLVVATATASGKTLCYNLPVAQALLADPAARALYLFPTKALAHDQLAELNALQLSIVNCQLATLAPARSAGVDNYLKAATYDGDTPQRERGRIRLRCQQPRVGDRHQRAPGLDQGLHHAATGGAGGTQHNHGAADRPGIDYPGHGKDSPVNGTLRLARAAANTRSDSRSRAGMATAVTAAASSQVSRAPGANH